MPSIMLKDFKVRDIRGGDRNKYDQISYGLYSAALTAHPDILAGDYARQLMSEIETNFIRYTDLITFVNSLDWDISYLSIAHFMLQNKTIASEFAVLERKIRTELPLSEA